MAEAKGRILWIGDAGAHSGFASVTHGIGERLVVDYGWDIHVIASNYLGDHWPTALKLYVANQKEPKDIIGQSRFIEMLARVTPDAIVFVQDPKVVVNALMTNQWDAERVLWRGMIAKGGLRYRPPIVAYMPIDGYNSPRQWDMLTDRVVRVAMSEFGKATMPEAPVVHHGVDTKIFYPRDKRESKRALGFDPDRFLVLRVDKNSWRKDYPSTWRALRPLLRRHPDIDVHFHCRMNASDGYDLTAVRWNDEDIRDRLTFTPGLQGLSGFTGLSQDQLAMLYSAADIFLSTSWGEGFGLSLLEAMACGTPVVAQDCTAITEVVGPAGILVPPGERVYMPMGQEQCLPNVAAFTEAVESLYSSRRRRRELGAAGVAQAAKFSWDVAAITFDDLLTKAIAANKIALAEVPDAVPSGGGPATSDQEEVRALR